VSEFAALGTEVLGHFKRRTDPGGVNTYPSPLDELAYCYLDTVEIGTETQGFPNRLAVAAYTGEPAYLTLHGNADPSHWAARMRGSKWGSAL